MGQLFTIGYANKELENFIIILKKHGVDCIIDVRSFPYSNQFQDYNKNNLQNVLKENGIIYMHFKNEFGARRIEDEVYKTVRLIDNSFIDVVIFDKVWKLNIFKEGILRIENGIKKGYKICFLCSEKYPYECHRGLMVSEFLFRKGYPILHIIDENNAIEHREIQKIYETKFNEEKNVFNKLYSSQLIYETDIFGNNVRNQNPNLEYWENFFKQYTLDKGHYLMNLKVGYKKGNDEND